MIIKVRVIPNSKRNDVVSRIGSILRVKIAAPAVEGLYVRPVDGNGWRTYQQADVLLVKR